MGQAGFFVPLLSWSFLTWVFMAWFRGVGKSWMPDSGSGMTEGGGCMSHGQAKGGWVNIMTNRPNGTLSLGVTANLPRRAWEHRDGVVEGFTRRYGLRRLVYTERHEDIRDAIHRERAMKHWARARKIRLIVEINPAWDDLYDQLAGGV